MSARAPAQPVSSVVLGMVLFISSEVMFFGGLFGAYFTLRSSATVWPPEGTPEIELGLPLVLTAMLLSSSITMHRAVHAASDADKRRWLAVTMLLGVLFLAGQAAEYAQAELSIRTNVFTSLFVTMTGFHGLHVAGGVFAMSLAFGRLRRRPAAGMTTAVGYYWHFVDVIWVVLFAVLYLLR